MVCVVNQNIYCMLFYILLCFCKIKTLLYVLLVSGYLIYMFGLRVSQQTPADVCFYLGLCEPKFVIYEPMARWNVNILRIGVRTN